ncbi:Multiple RNA-binding domain-containing protein 1 [Wickerhamomyces ciferrii]|uniref:Multiple RNA-binding domain-containing protein 1 n=1 Tax=Wickerhamomyces ciferrii (strain ATCC 14091 / BCRC 22168 / CBS 111 / JCM 3599 / NBRC 0793 / NRRL Y-1031 F-60-10) TaxID=1206466 RepID=K0KG91_WICCF|nr:Multiple RNA-binding domain-containing protein 1 [Wickerhamomyces ciferrii]CCH41202.1 Multiple RNA-binding domain-containing protein 1 [Wickerhamomyces ciferrii]
MSRLIVKGLPKYLDEEKLRDHFAKKGDITDVKLRKNRAGESRRFAFIGFKRQEDAEEAVRYFNGSFIDTAKIEVSIAKSFVDPSVPKSFKEKRREAFDRIKQREREEQEREEAAKEQERRKRQKIDKKSKIDQDIENDPKLKEFIESMKPSTQAKSWSNDVVVNEGGAPSNSLLDKVLAMKGDGSNDDNNNKFENKFADEIFKVQENESDDEYDAFGKTKQDQEEQEDDEPMMDLDDFGKDEGEIEDKENQEEDISDMEWLKRRRVRIKENGEVVDKPKTNSIEPQNDDQKEEEVEQKNSEKAAEKSSSKEPEELKPSEEETIINKIRTTGRLFLRNLLYSSKEEEFRELFSKYGELEEVHIAIDTRTGQSKGFAYIQFVNPDDAVQAYIEQDKQIFQGRLLHILPGDSKKNHRLDEFDLKNLPLKKQRELKKKNDASKHTFSWNSLYMNNDAVLNSIASSMGLQKRDLIDPESSNSAVKQALAEAHVIGDVRKFFENKGIDLTKFQDKERDDSIILIKNFPFGTTEAELLELFTPFGPVKRIIMPPSGTIAIIQFRDLPSGRSAFTKLCYRRFKKGILYLEKGPKDLFTREPESDEIANNSETPKEDVKEVKDNARDIMEDEQVQEDEDIFEGPTVSIFVKNLNFNTTSSQLTSVFEKLTGFVVATIKTKPDPRDSSKTQSMGFGFVEFKTKEQANIAISTLDNTVLDGHKLQLKLSHRQNVVKKTSTNKAVSSKIIVKNLPFEASRKDVFELFNSFGQLKSVRVPKKFDKSARGFAFVEFLIPKEAQSAMDQLQGVHLLGRRLVMQYAEQGSDDVEAEIEKMTKKVKKQVATQQLGALRLNGKRKLDLEDDDEEGVDNI